jgi:hypothetical protein
MKCSPLALALILAAGPARAGTELLVTAGGGHTGETAVQGCLDQGNGICPANGHPAVAMLGAGMARVSDSGVRGSLRLEGAFSVNKLRGRYGQLLGAAGWQGEWVILEGGLGSALLWSPGKAGAQLAGVLHAGLGVRLLPSLSVVARIDQLVSDDSRPYFLMGALEWLPLFKGGF